ncbi:MAG: aminodeoxychorismate synthase component I [Colwellia sp.]
MAAHQSKAISAKVLPLKQGITPAEIFAPISHQDWAIWLDSSDSEHVDSRFDILVWAPIATLTTHGNTTEICFPKTEQNNDKKHGSKSNSLTSTNDPLLLIKELQCQLFKQPDKPHEFLPFLGGALGYFAYDLARQFEQVPTIAKEDIHLPDMAVGLYDHAIIFDKTSALFYLVCPEEQRSKIEASLINATAHAKNLKKSSTKMTTEPFQLTSTWQANMDKASYIEKFNTVQNYLISGDCYQINLAQRFSAHYHGDEFEAYLALRETNKAPFSAFIRLGSTAILSISPERFLKLSQGKVQSKPIKGTIARSHDKIQDAKNAEILKHSSKDKAENLMIVDLLRNDISRSCQAGTVKVPSLFEIESFPAVHHLVSTVEGTLSHDKHATDLLRGAFPGGSITGAPKIRAMEIIEELEPHRRNVYCGSIGYLSNCGTMDTSITIRTLLCQKNEVTSNSTNNSKKNTIHCWAGGGLVADSTAQSEYQETFDKVNCILPVLSKINQQ